MRCRRRATHPRIAVVAVSRAPTNSSARRPRVAVAPPSNSDASALGRPTPCPPPIAPPLRWSTAAGWAGQQRARHPSRRASSGGPEQRCRPPPVPASPSNSAARIGGPDWPAVAPGEQPIGRARLRARVAPPRSRPGPPRSCSTYTRVRLNPREHHPPGHPPRRRPTASRYLPGRARAPSGGSVACLVGVSGESVGRVR